MPDIFAIPALSDNYIWVIAPTPTDPGSRVVIVDPGEAAPVLQWLAQRQLRIGAILVTHHHPDHTAGINALLEDEKARGNDNIPVHGPASESDRITQITHPLTDGDRVILDWLALEFDIIATPGHTLGHIVFHAPGMLLAGDTLFRGGCGRVFEGTPEQMQQGLARLRDLPDDTRLYAGHEYTQKNLAFASMVEPDNADIARLVERVKAIRERGEPSLPGTIAEERDINPFLRWDVPAVTAAASERAGQALHTPADVFAVLRAWKDAS